MSYTINHETTDQELFLDILADIICQYLDSHPIEDEPLHEPAATESHSEPEAA